MTPRPWGLLLAGAVLAGCAGAAPLTISSRATRQLERQVAAVRADAAGQDPAGAARELGSLEEAVTALERDGQISAARAAAILDAARAVQVDHVLIPTTTTTTTTTTTVPAAPTRPKHGEGHDQGGGGQD